MITTDMDMLDDLRKMNGLINDIKIILHMENLSATTMCMAIREMVKEH